MWPARRAPQVTQTHKPQPPRSPHLRRQHGRVLDDCLPHAPVLVCGQVLHSRQQRLRQQLNANHLQQRRIASSAQPGCPPGLEAVALLQNADTADTTEFRATPVKQLNS